MRVLMINQVFYPDVAATAQHAHDLARHLVAQGHAVEVIASRSIYGQAGAVLPKHEMIEGIEVHRVGRSYFGKSSTLARLLDFSLFFIAATVKAFLVGRPDVVICFTTPPLIALVGVLLKTIRRCRFVYWVMDLYPDLPIACGVMKARGLPARIFETLHRMCLRRADRCVVLGRCMQQRVLAKGISPEQLNVIHVWSDSDEVQPVPHSENQYRKQWNLNDDFVVMYSGNYGVGHDVQTMLDAAKILAHRDDIRFVFAGGGVRKAEVEQYIRDQKLANAQSQPYQPRERLAELLSAADLHLGSQSNGMVGLFVPSKLFGVMAAARPMVFIGDHSAENALVITENQCGHVIDCGDSRGLADLIQQLADDPSRAAAMGQRARQALIDKYSRQDGCAAWERLLLEVVHRAHMVARRSASRVPTPAIEPPNESSSPQSVPDAAHTPRYTRS